jgi:hypothetical protein
MNDIKMQILGSHIAVSWDYCTPYVYGVYSGLLKNGKVCTIDVDWKIKVKDLDGNMAGTDEIQYWLCSASHIKDLIDALHKY